MAREVILITCRENDPTKEVEKGAAGLMQKMLGRGIVLAECELPLRTQPDYISRRDRLTRSLKNVDESSLIYVLGHGDWQNQTVGGYAYHVWVQALLISGLKEVGTISILGCSVGRDRGAADDCRLGSSVDSFAGKFHAALGKAGIRCTAFARIYDVAILPTGHKRTGNAGTTDADHHRQFSKLKFCWEGGKQQRKWAYKGEDETEAQSRRLGFWVEV